MRLLALSALLLPALLAGCSPIGRGAADEPAVLAEEAAPAAAPTSKTDCQAGDDDGIGGTGCKID